MSPSRRDELVKEILAGFQRTGDKSNESAIKYLLLGGNVIGAADQKELLASGAVGRDALKGDVRRQGNVLGVHLENRGAAGAVGTLYHDAAVEAARP